MSTTPDFFPIMAGVKSRTFHWHYKRETCAITLDGAIPSYVTLCNKKVPKSMADVMVPKTIVCCDVCSRYRTQKENQEIAYAEKEIRTPVRWEASGATLAEVGGVFDAFEPTVGKVVEVYCGRYADEWRISCRYYTPEQVELLEADKEAKNNA